MEKPQFIGAEIKALNNLIKRRFEEGFLKNQPNRPTGAQGMIIGYLARHQQQAVFQRDIETEFNIRRSTATGMLKLMEKNGLIVRTPVPYDERLKKITLTPEAIAMHEKIMAHLTEIERLLALGLSKEEVERFLQIIETMKNNLSLGECNSQ